MFDRRYRHLRFVAAAIVVLSTGAAGVSAPQPAGTIERITVPGPALEGNLEGSPSNRPVVVYLPASYGTDTTRRYPVLYFLHGYNATAEIYTKTLALPGSVDRAIAAGGMEMIVVLPDAMSKFGGSMYANSPTVGDWETFLASDLPAHIDGRYRTIATRGGRGLAGHSMGGYGVMRVGMKRPEAFGALYAMSSCCLMNDPAGRGGGAPRGEGAGRGDGAARGAGRGEAPARGAGPGPGPGRGGRGMGNALSAQASAWAPNPGNPPDFFDLPTRDGQLRPLIAAKWIANSPLIMVDQHVPGLRSMRAIAIDVGDADPFVGTNTQLSEALTRLRVPNEFEVYEGDHGNRVRERFETKVLAFFGRHLTGAAR